MYSELTTIKILLGKKLKKKNPPKMPPKARVISLRNRVLHKLFLFLVFPNFFVIMSTALIVEKYEISTKHSHELPFAFLGRIKQFITRNGFWSIREGCVCVRAHALLCV